MLLIIAAMSALVAGPTDTWGMGGGRAWMNPPKVANDQYRRWGIDRPSTKSQREADLREFALLQEKARRGDVIAMRVTGFVMLQGIVAPPDPIGAMGWFYEAALRGDAPSMFVLGCAFEYGVGVEADAKLAGYWHDRAEKLGGPKTCL